MWRTNEDNVCFNTVWSNEVIEVIYAAFTTFEFAQGINSLVISFAFSCLIWNGIHLSHLSFCFIFYVIIMHKKNEEKKRRFDSLEDTFVFKVQLSTFSDK